MNDSPQEEHEKLLLLQATGEITVQDKARLAVLDAVHPDHAAWERFVRDELPSAARAPRDFAGEAIAAALPQRNILRFPLLWKLSAAAAAILVIFAAMPRPSSQVVAPVAMIETPARTRLTTALSERLDTVESELATTRSRLTRSRYTRQPSI